MSCAAAPRRALTLVELMIAMVLGLVIMGMAFSAVRAMQQAYRIAAAERTVNHLLIAGYHLGMAEADEWRAHDAPETAAGQGLRAPGSSFAPLSLPPAARFAVPSDPRWWDRGGPRAYAMRFDGGTRLWQTWPDPGQTSGIGHGRPDAAFLDEVQDSIRRAGGVGLVAAAWPGHLPLGNHTPAATVPSSAPATFAVGWFDALVDPTTTPTDHKDEAESVTYPSASRYGRSQNGKVWYLPARRAWGARSDDGPETLTDLDTAGRYALRNTREPWLVATRTQELVDPLVVYASVPGFAAGGDGTHTTRLELRRVVDRNGERTSVHVIVADNATGRILHVPFAWVGTTLLGARMNRGLER